MASPHRPQRRVPPVPTPAFRPCLRRIASAIALLASLGAACAGLDRPPDRDRALLHAEADLASGDAEAAVEGFRALLVDDPEDPAALAGLARALLAEGRPEPALEALDRLDALGRDSSARADRLHCRVWLAALEARAQLDDLDGALELAQRRDAGSCRADTTGRARAQAYQTRALAERAAGHPDEALLAFRQAALGPEPGVEVYAGAAEILIDQGRYDEAVTWLRSALDAHPRDRRLLALMVVALSGGLGPRPD